MSTIKRRLSGTRNFAAAYNQQQQQQQQQGNGASTPAGALENTSFAPSAGNANSGATSSGHHGSLSHLAGPLPLNAQPISMYGGAPPKVVRLQSVTDIAVALSASKAADQEGEQEQAAAEAAAATTTKIAALEQRLRDLAPVPKPRDTLTKRVSITVLRRVAAFVGSSFRELAPFASMCRTTRAASTHCVESVTLVPDETSVAALSKTGAMDSFGKFVKRGEKGQHARSFCVVDPAHVYKLEASVLGPSVGPADLLRTIATMPLLTTVDVRSVALRGYAPWCDTFMADVAKLCPLLQTLRVGVSFARAWQRGWWQPVSGSLREVVIGSRREDAEFLDHNINNNNDDDGSTTTTMTVTVPLPPLQLPLDDVFAMARSTQLAVLKVWPALSFPQMSQLLFPSGAAVPNLRHLSVTVGAANGQLLFTPEGEALIQQEREQAGGAGGADANTASSGGGARGGGGGGAQRGGGVGNAAASPGAGRGGGGGGGRAAAAAAAAEEASRAANATYPGLVSITIADVNSKPDLVSDIMQRLAVVAPHVEHYNITNTHKQGPTAAALALAASQTRTRRPHAPSSSP